MCSSVRKNTLLTVIPIFAPASAVRKAAGRHITHSLSECGWPRSPSRNRTDGSLGKHRPRSRPRPPWTGCLGAVGEAAGPSPDPPRHCHWADQMLAKEGPSDLVQDSRDSCLPRRSPPRPQYPLHSRSGAAKSALASPHCPLGTSQCHVARKSDASHAALLCLGK